jgi:hypothetical protein
MRAVETAEEVVGPAVAVAAAAAAAATIAAAVTAKSADAAGDAALLAETRCRISLSLTVFVQAAASRVQSREELNSGADSLCAFSEQGEVVLSAAEPATTEPALSSSLQNRICKNENEYLKNGNFMFKQ